MNTKRIIAVITAITFLVTNPSWLAKALPFSTQNQVVPIGLLRFQDESGAGASPELLKRITQDLRQRLSLNFQDVLPRLIGGDVDLSAMKTMNAEQAAALGKQYGVRFVVRGGLLTLSSGGSGDQAKASAQLYAEIFSVDSLTPSIVRAEGVGAQQGGARQTSAIDPATREFQSSAVGQAVAAAAERLAAAIHEAILSPAPVATNQPVTNEQPSTTATSEQHAVLDESLAGAESDEELQQLMAQAESLISGASAASSAQLDALKLAVEGLKSALASKADLVEKNEDAAAADQKIAAKKEELRSVVSEILEQTSSTEATQAETGEVTQPDGQYVSGEKKSVLASISEYLGEAFNIIQKIQEIRSTFQSASEEAYATESTAGETPTSEEPFEDAVTEEQPAQEETTGDVSGVVTDSGEPVQDVTVTEPESGSTTTTSKNGTYVLKGILARTVAKLIISKNGRQVGRGQVSMRNRSGIADFDLKAGSGVRITPSVVPVREKKSSAATGRLEGVVRDGLGRAVPRALVLLKGLAVARTDSMGRYAFFGVPPGDHQLTIQGRGLNPRSQNVQISSKKSSQSDVTFAPGDRLANDIKPRPVILRGANTSLRGLVVDGEKHAIGGAKITLLQGRSTVSIFTSPKGSYQLRDLQPGAYRVVVSKAGFDSSAQGVAVRSGKTTSHDFQLKKKEAAFVAKALENWRKTHKSGSRPILTTGAQTTPGKVKRGQIVGRVIDAQLRWPIVGATISIRGQGNIRTNEEGNFIIANLASGNHRVKVSKPGYSEQEQTIMIRDGFTTREGFALRKESGRDERTGPAIPGGHIQVRPGSLRGFVTDAKTNRPVAGAIILISGQRSIVTGRDGGFALGNLPQGSYQLVVRKGGYYDSAGMGSVRAGQTATANIRLRAKESLSPGVRLPGVRRH